VPNLALRRERAPNGDGARLAGYTADWARAVGAAGSAGLIILLDPELDDAEVAALAGARLVRFATIEDDRLAGAELVLPVTTVVEENGTFVNRDGRVQRYMQARSAPGMAQPAWWVAAGAWELGQAGRAAPGTAAEAFAAQGPRFPPSPGSPTGNWA
jgi:NADH-quinone oxidoreductase subunit G